MSMISSSTGRAFGSVEVLFVKMLRVSEVICTRATEVRPSHERGASYHVSSVGCHMTCGCRAGPNAIESRMDVGQRAGHSASALSPRLRDESAGDRMAHMSPGGGLFSTPGCPGSIVGATTFHFRVRDENGWVRRALTTKGYSVARIRGLGK